MRTRYGRSDEMFDFDLQDARRPNDFRPISLAYAFLMLKRMASIHAFLLWYRLFCFYVI